MSGPNSGVYPQLEVAVTWNPDLVAGDSFAISDSSPAPASGTALICAVSGCVVVVTNVRFISPPPACSAWPDWAGSCWENE